MFPNFWYARWDISTSHLLLKSANCIFLQDEMAVRTLSLKIQEKISNPHLRDRQPLALYLAGL